MISTVWLFFILGVTPASQHQAIDLFPTKGDCEAFRLNVTQMLDMGLAPGSRVTTCLSRSIVTVGSAQHMRARGNHKKSRTYGII